MKRENIMDDLQEFLGVSHKQLASFFNVSRALVTHAALGTRKFPFRLNQRRLDMLNLMIRLKAEATAETESAPSFSPAFLQDRLEKVETRIRVLNQEISRFKQKEKTKENALRFYQTMSAEFTDLTPLDKAWIQKETNVLTLGPPPKGNLEKWQWERNMLLTEKEMLQKELRFTMK